MKIGFRKRDILMEKIYLVADDNVPKGGWVVFYPDGHAKNGRHSQVKTQVACALEDVDKGSCGWFVVYGKTKGLFGPVMQKGEERHLYFCVHIDFTLDDFQHDIYFKKIAGVVLQESTEDPGLYECTLNYPETWVSATWGA